MMMARRISAGVFNAVRMDGAEETTGIVPVWDEARRARVAAAPPVVLERVSLILRSRSCKSCCRLSTAAASPSRE